MSERVVVRNTRPDHKRMDSTARKRHAPERAAAIVCADDATALPGACIVAREQKHVDEVGLRKGRQMSGMRH
jgi:hypothetical protein